MKILPFAAAAVLGAWAVAAQALEFTIGDITIHDPTAFETARTAKSGGGYLSIINNGPQDDRLLGVQADFPRVMLHTTETKDDVARMRHVDAIDIPAGQTVALEPGGFHVMFMGLDGDPFELDEKIPAKLIFEKAGEIEVMFSVKSRSDTATKHDGHGAGH